MVRGSPGPRNRTNTDVLWTSAGARKALNSPGRRPAGHSYICVDTGVSGHPRDATGFRVPGGGRSAAFGVILEVVDLLVRNAELLLVGFGVGAVLMPQHFDAV